MEHVNQHSSVAVTRIWRSCGSSLPGVKAKRSIEPTAKALMAAIEHDPKTWLQAPDFSH
jgi:hypothetical protein